MRPETRKVLERSIDREKEALMLQQPDEILHDFLTHASKPEFEKDRTLVPAVRAELTKRMNDRLQAAVELLRETHGLTEKTYTVTRKLDQKTLWILWLTAIAAVLAFLALVLGK